MAPWHAREVIDVMPDQLCESYLFYGATACVVVNHVGLRSIAVAVIALRDVCPTHGWAPGEGCSLPDVRWSEWLWLFLVCLGIVSELGRQIRF